MWVALHTLGLPHPPYQADDHANRKTAFGLACFIVSWSRLTSKLHIRLVVGTIPGFLCSPQYMPLG
jgi:hypothetical protein